MLREPKPYDSVKRALDVTLSAIGLIVTAPIQLATAGVVLATLGRPVLFRQPRPGLDGKVFELVKFRTMKQPDAKHQTDAERLTKVGRCLRSTSLDELPTLWNVLKGDMSLVGPRPLLVEYLPLYSEHQFRRHEVRPGITGLAQVNGRNLLSWDEKFDHDVRYVDGRSLMLDARVLWETLAKVIQREGISQLGSATMRPFAGSRPSPEHLGEVL